MNMDDEIYTQNILDRYRRPKNKRTMENFDAREAGVNPSCGDSLVLFLKFDEMGSIEDASFDGEGCAISQASADMLMGKVHGMRREEAKRITKEDVCGMLGISVGPAREKCALLAWGALQSALAK